MLMLVVPGPHFDQQGIRMACPSDVQSWEQVTSLCATLTRRLTHVWHFYVLIPTVLILYFYFSKFILVNFLKIFLEQGEL